MSRPPILAKCARRELLLTCIRCCASRRVESARPLGNQRIHCPACRDATLHKVELADTGKLNFHQLSRAAGRLVRATSIHAHE